MATDLDSLIDSQATITGKAGNAHAGAVVLTDDRTPVYIDGLESWDEDGLNGKDVSVSGTLRKRSIAPKAEVNADGDVSHGMDDDDVFVLVGATWSEA
jgi:hypothetical protein